MGRPAAAVSAVHTWSLSSRHFFLCISLGADTTSVSPSRPTTSTAEYSARTVAFNVRTTLGHAPTRSSVGAAGELAASRVAGGRVDGCVDECVAARVVPPTAGDGWALDVSRGRGIGPVTSRG